MTDVLAAAVDALEAGLSVIPAAVDGSKAPWPDGPRWKAYQARRADPGQLTRWFGGAGPYGGFGVVCGQISGNLELLEFEGRAVAEGVLDEFMATATAAGLIDLVDRIVDGYSETTPSGGVHWLYRVDGPPVGGNTKLASRPALPGEATTGERVMVLIETRGEGGFGILAPSNGTTHPTGGRWEITLGGFDTITTITEEEHVDLLDLARSFDRSVASGVESEHGQVEHVDGLRPGDDYEARTTWPEVLEPLGWRFLFTTSEGVGHWCRPGKSRGTSATTNANGTDRLKVHSTSTDLDTAGTYSRFAVYAHAHHGDDYAAAARHLRKQGYGGAPPVVVDEQTTGDDQPIVEHQCTDLGNARRLVDAAGQDLRYVHEWGRWLTWDGRRWCRDLTGEVHRRAKAVVDAILVEAATTASPNRRDALMKWWKQSQAAQRLGAMVNIATTELPVPALVDQLDGDPWLLNVANGTLDLRTGALMPADRTQLLTKLAPVDFDPEATCPRFEAFLDLITGSDPELAGFIQRAVGYSLTGTVGEQVLFFAHGGGQNGKSTLMGVLQRILGDYAQAAAPNLLITTRDAEHPTAVADLVGTRLVVSQEVDQGRRLAEATVKALTGGDLIKARFMRQDFFNFWPTHKIWLSANHKPFVRGTDHAIWRRIRLIPFEARIPDDQRVNHYEHVLFAEASGILNWALAGCLEWQARGLQVPARVADATALYRDENDDVGRFISECCDLGPNLRAQATPLRERYVEWCEANGERPMSARALGPHLRERGLESTRDRARHSWWLGIAIREGSRIEILDQDFRESATLCDPSPYYPHNAGAQSVYSEKGSKGSRRVAGAGSAPNLTQGEDLAGIDWEPL